MSNSPKLIEPTAEPTSNQGLSFFSNPKKDPEPHSAAKSTVIEMMQKLEAEIKKMLGALAQMKTHQGIQAKANNSKFSNCNGVTESIQKLSKIVSENNGHHPSAPVSQPQSTVPGYRKS